MSSAKLKVVAPSAPDASAAIVRAREVSSDAIDALVLLSKGDFASADSALKRVMVTAHEARQALALALSPPVPAKALVDQALAEWG
jgi:hypothetical protein